MGKKPINPYAVGAQFLDYCVKQGWLIREGTGRNKRWHLTEKAKGDLKNLV